ncbi:MAG: transposase family protein [Planctomycetes bacterium]|nr:transposase family protein [Planctomycetota bacterium]
MLPRRGRKPKELTPLMQTAVRVLHERHPGWGVRRLREAIPGLPRNAAGRYLRHLRKDAARVRRSRLCRVSWLVPGAVWAIDGGLLKRRVDGGGRRVLVVVEQHSRRTLCMEPVAGERAEEVQRVLAALFAKHGAPIVLKLDNGPGFIARTLRDFCREHGVTLLFSPVRRPSWNGGCEVRVRWSKDRTEKAWLRRRGAGDYTRDDLATAVTLDGTLPPVDEPLRERFRDTLAQQLRIAAAEKGVDLLTVSRDHARRSLWRVAAKRALQLCHMLTIEDRRYPQWFPPSAA